MPYSAVFMGWWCYLEQERRQEELAQMRADDDGMAAGACA